MADVPVYVAMGSNIQPAANLRSCLRQLATRFGELHVSRTYRNPPVGFAGDDFYNLVVGFRTTLSPLSLQQQLKTLEQQHGRQRGKQAGLNSRTLDLDLLLYADWVDAGLKLPHPDILRYVFVLQPLAEIAGAVTHPLTGQSIDALWAQRQTAMTTEVLQAVHL